MSKNNLFNEKFGTDIALTFDDVLLVPRYSEVLPRDVDIRTQLTRNIKINIPFISAAMDTVTGVSMGIAMARNGGIGVIHKNMSIKAQAKMVYQVKRADAGIIHNPITLQSNATIGEAKRIMKEHKIGGIPILEGKKLVGILTNRDVRSARNLSKSVSLLMTKENLRTATTDTSMKRAEALLSKWKIEKLPVIDNHGHLVGLITYRDILKIKSFPNSVKDHSGRLLSAAAIGVAKDTLERVHELNDVGVDVLFIDTAHGHSKGVIDLLKQIKKEYPEIDIVAGNVATGDATKILIRAGADAIKVGVGPGSICTTRVIAGVGVPQITAVFESAQAARGTSVPIISDGGIHQTGDVPKAITAGASSIMAGSMFAGTEEAPGETIIFEGRKHKTYRGMGTVEAMQEGSADRYGQDAESDVKKLVPEGIVGRVPYKGLVSEVLDQAVGGLRASMGYLGAKNIQSLQTGTFRRITTAGLRESHPHDVTMVKGAPNYSGR